MRVSKRKKIIIVLFALILSLSVGFALLQANLTINGSSKIKGSSWDIHFENLNVTEGSVELSDGDVAASIQSNTTDISYTVTLNKPGDFYEFTVDAVNAGSNDGMVESVTSKLNDAVITTLPTYLNYSVTYETNDEIQPNHFLKANTSETYKVRIEFKKDISATDLPTTAQTLNIEFNISFIQADSNGVEVKHPKFVYTVNKHDTNATSPKYNAVWLNQKFPETIPYFETPTEALSAIVTASGKKMYQYLKHKLVDEIVTESYVEFVVTKEIAQANPGTTAGTYTLRAERTYDYDTSTWLVDENYIGLYYEENKEITRKALGTNCIESGTGRSSYVYCSISGIIGVRINANGDVSSSNTFGEGCSVDVAGRARCNWQ